MSGLTRAGTHHILWERHVVQAQAIIYGEVRTHVFFFKIPR